MAGFEPAAPGTAFAGRGSPERLSLSCRREWKDGNDNATAPAHGPSEAMSDSAASLRALAHKCRCLAVGGSMNNVVTALNEIAHDYDRQADRVDKAEARARERLAARPGSKGD